MFDYGQKVSIGIGLRGSFSRSLWLLCDSGLFETSPDRYMEARLYPITCAFQPAGRPDRRSPLSGAYLVCGHAAAPRKRGIITTPATPDA